MMRLLGIGLIGLILGMTTFYWQKGASPSEALLLAVENIVSTVLFWREDG